MPKFVSPLRMGGMLGVFVMLFLISSFRPPSQGYIFPFKDHHILAGTFGELRSTHFHAGLDIKTDRRIGIPVRAIADGYVYRLKTSPFGFGLAVYLKHPDGNFSVYAHLSRFTEALEAFQYTQQKEAGSWEHETYLTADRFLVKQGDIIGFSGNSGSSVGPHLHFEIRDSLERILNPLWHYRDLVPDSRRPLLRRISLDPLDYQARIEGIHRKKVLEPRMEKAGEYVLKRPIQIKGRVGLGYSAIDQLNGASNPCGINTARVFLDDSLIYRYDLQRFSFEEWDYIHMHIDYAYRKANSIRLQRAYLNPFNPFSGYDREAGTGIIDLRDSLVHALRLELQDVHGNQTTLRMQVQQGESKALVPTPPRAGSQVSTRLGYTFNQDALMLTIKHAPIHMATLGLQYENVLGQIRRIFPAYAERDKLTFLYPLDRYTLPKRIWDDSLQVNLSFPAMERLDPNQNKVVQMGDAQAFFPIDGVFEPTFISHTQQEEKAVLGPMYQIGDPAIPLFHGYILSVPTQPSFPVSQQYLAQKKGDEWEFAGSRKGPDGTLRAYCGSFGEFGVMCDSIPPSIRMVRFGKGGRKNPQTGRPMILAISDEGSGVRSGSISGEIDGQFVPLEYDKTRILGYLNRIELEKGKHTLTVRLSDRVGNETVKTFEVVW